MADSAGKIMGTATPFHWGDRTTEEFGDLARQNAIALLPLAATEQHGPHLPVSTDATICTGMLETLQQMLPDDLPIAVLPIQSVGKSNEHLRSPGTLTLPPETLIAAWVALGEGVHRAGLRKLLIVNAHGGNNPVMDIVARELRVRLGMLVVTTQWNRFGVPEGSVGAEELRHGVHAGMVETSLMLHFRPDLVRTARLRNFPSAAAQMERDFTHLHATQRHNIGWIIHDLNADGAVGNAAAGSAELGARIARHQVQGLIELLRDMQAFDPARLAGAGSGAAAAGTDRQRAQA